jgi:gluconolactonase
MMPWFRPSERGEGAMAETIPATFEMLDDRFRACQGDSRIERLYGDCRWAEGPVYLPAARSLVWSDIPNDRMLRWDETTGAVGLFRHPCGYANGNTLDGEARLITCEHGARRVSRTEHDGSITTLADRVDGKRLNSPNDAVVQSDGSIWFTDPAYGIDSDYEGHAGESETGGCHVYRIDPVTGSCGLVADDFDRPNGLALSDDEKTLFIADTRRNHIRRFSVGDGGRLTDDGVFCNCTAGVFDGFRLDAAGRIWAAAGDGVHCFDPDGTLIGKLRLPEPVANLVFGGPKRHVLFVTASTSLYSVYTNLTGAIAPWQRPRG